MTPSRLREEQEISVSFNNKDDHAIVWCGSPAHIRRLQKITKANSIEPVRVDSQGICWHVPKSWIAIRPPKKVKMTDERKAALSERFKKMREKQMLK